MNGTQRSGEIRVRKLERRCYRSQSIVLDELAKKYTAVLPLRLDVTAKTLTRRAVTAAIERFGSIDVLVNNAGYGLFGPLNGAANARV